MGLEATKDKVTGTVKERAGGLVGDDKMRREGKAEQTKGDLKNKASAAADHAADAMHKAADKVSGAVHRRT